LSSSHFSSMASDSPFPVTAQNINPHVLILSLIWLFQWCPFCYFLFLDVLEFQVLSFIDFYDLGFFCFIWLLFFSDF
jgi:hypothetical protein